MVFQFATSVLLLIGVAVIYEQLTYLRNAELGFNREQVLALKAKPQVNQKFQTFRESLLQNPNIINVAGCSDLPGNGAGVYRFVPEEGSVENPVFLPMSVVDFDFMETMNINLKKGRALMKDNPIDKSESFLLNQKAVQQLGWEEDPIGKSLQLFGPGTNEIVMKGKVIGVFENYHTESLHNEVKPLVLSYYDQHAYYLIKLNAENPNKTIEFIKEKWSNFAPQWPTEISFLDQDLEALYTQEEKLSKTINYFTILGLLIAIIGLYSLSSFTLLKRAKEMSIRKVLGANQGGLMLLVSKDILKLIGVSILIAWPVAYFGAGKWLQNFAYSVNLDWKVFLGAALITIFLSFIAICYNVIKVTSANPIDSLKIE